MPYKCAFGCNSYNPLCDACDSETTNDNAYIKDDSHILHAAALLGMTKDEYTYEDEVRNEQ